MDPVRPVKNQEQEQDKAPKSSDSVSLSDEAVELYSAFSVSDASESENYTEDSDDRAKQSTPVATAATLKSQNFAVQAYAQAMNPSVGSYVNIAS
ncbi:MAG: hypothetical protein AB7E76_13740 [Deferribacterales bacterium]